MNLSEFSRKGGKSGTGAAKARKTSFTSETAKAAVAARWAKRKPKRVARRSNDELCGASDASASAIGSHPNGKTK